MLTPSSGIRTAIASIAAGLILSSSASAQPAPAPVRPAPVRPATASPKPVAAPGQQPAVKPVAAAPRGGAACHGGMSFDRFLADLKQQAVAAGVSQRALAEASPSLVYDQGIVNRDRGQRVFGQAFTEFARRMAADYRMQQGRQRIKTYAAAFARAEKEYGVPPAVIAAFWGLESDFGANMGNLPTLPAAAPRCSRTRPSRP
jgi:membrane-bound lytic murein transglycosylase B